MKSHRIYQIGLTLFALLVIALQTGAMAHAAQNTDDAHEHNGVVCVLDAVASEAEATLPAMVFVPAPVIAPPVVYISRNIESVYITPPGRAPPPRSPPKPTF